VTALAVKEPTHIRSWLYLPSSGKGGSCILNLKTEKYMQCNCGGSTAEKTVIKGKKVVASYQECTSCKRVHITRLPVEN